MAPYIFSTGTIARVGEGPRPRSQGRFGIAGIRTRTGSDVCTVVTNCATPAPSDDYISDDFVSGRSDPLVAISVMAISVMTISVMAISVMTISVMTSSPAAPIRWRRRGTDHHASGDCLFGVRHR